MLNKKICKLCSDRVVPDFIKDASDPQVISWMETNGFKWGKVDEIHWKIGHMRCRALGLYLKTTDEPPEKCPYGLEHEVSTNAK